MSEPSPSLHAFVISWHGMAGRAQRIAAAVHGLVEHLSVIHSSVDGSGPAGPGEWHQVDNRWFYGPKFRRCLDLHRGEVMLQIQADAECDDWAQLVRRCREAFAAWKELGVWAPEVVYTPFPLQQASIRRFREGSADGCLHQVAQTDGVVWALAPRVLERLRQLDYTANNLGWGIDWAAIAFAHCSNLLVLCDTAVTIGHPRGSGYDPTGAAAQKQAFLAQLTPQEQVQVEVLGNHLHWRKPLPTRVLLAQLRAKLRQRLTRRRRRAG